MSGTNSERAKIALVRHTGTLNTSTNSLNGPGRRASGQTRASRWVGQVV